MRWMAWVLAGAVSAGAGAQWTMQESHTTASLRGIHSVGNGVAWASGTSGTVLRTVDGGKNWQMCAVPERAEKLDFRGVQGFDEKTAIVMSSGKGDLSRLYKTVDGCGTWKLVFVNPDKEGFWDGLKFTAGVERADGQRFRNGIVIGDPVNGRFSEFVSHDNGSEWTRRTGDFFPAFSRDNESLFAASNSAFLMTDHSGEIFVTGGKSGSRSRILSEYVKHDPQVSVKFVGGEIPLLSGESAGAFSIATSYLPDDVAEAKAANKDRIFFFPATALCVVVGGDYRKPDKNSDTAAFSVDGGQHWKASKTPPSGYRSSVAYEFSSRMWITVGPNGTDVSTDDGLNWGALKPGVGEPADVEKNWNALSLPFVVGPKGRIGVLRADALKKP